MWIYLNNSFLSIVQHREKKDHLLVRARIRKDIETVFPDAKVKRTTDADYLFRATIPRTVVSDAIVNQIGKINYPNFKASVPNRGRQRLYGEVWEVMYKYQQRKQGYDT